MNISEQYKQAAQVLKQASALLVTSGAGMGVDSGLPDFRGDKGFWKAYPPIAKRGISFSDMANPTWFDSEPHLAWAFYGHRLNLYRETIPHNGFTQLLELGKTKKDKYFAYTSNVDGQFQKAGYDPYRVVEPHGSIHIFQCTQNCTNELWPAPPEEIRIDEERFVALDPLPECPHCQAIARPAILMFGDWAWNSANTNQQSHRFVDWLDSLTGKLAIVEIGAGGAVPTVRMKSQQLVRHLDATLIRINPREPQVPNGHISIPKGAVEALDGIWKYL